MMSYVSVAAAAALSRAERRRESGEAGAARHGQRAAGHQSAHAPGVSKVKGVSPHPELWTSPLQLRTRRNSMLRPASHLYRCVVIIGR